MNVLGRIFLNSRKDRWKDGKTERRKDIFFWSDVKILTFLIMLRIFGGTNNISPTIS